MTADMTGLVNTVRGPRRPKELGVTMPHEHVVVELRSWYMGQEDQDQLVSLENLGEIRRRPYSTLDNLQLLDRETQTREVAEFRDVGGGTLVDLTLDGMGRDPVALAEISAATDVHIVCGTGYYVHTAHPPEVASATAAELADRMVAELTQGIGDTPVRAGVIGEIGTWDPIHVDELKVLEAAAEAHRRTGAPIVVHTYLFAKHGHEVIDVLTGFGVQPDRIALAHVDSTLPDVSYHQELAQRDVYVCYDLFGGDTANDDWREADADVRFIPPMPSDMDRLRGIRTMLDSGYGNRLLLSQDVCMKVHLKSFGGNGYGHILRNVVPLMRDSGYSDAEVVQLVERNPQEWLAWSRPVQ